MSKSSISSIKAPFGAWHHYQKNGQQYHWGTTTFSSFSLFIILFALIWIGVFLIFLYGMFVDLFIEEDGIEWINFLFLFTHGIPAFFLSWAAVDVIFRKITLTIDPHSLYIFEGYWSMGKKQQIPIKDLKFAPISDTEDTTPSFIVYVEEEALYLGKDLSDKRQAFLLTTLYYLMKQLEQDDFFLGRDLSAHLVQ